MIATTITTANADAPKIHAPTDQAPAKIADALQIAAPGSIKIGGHLGEQLDLCLKQRIEAQDVDQIVKPFNERKDNWEWRSEFWGKWITSAIAAYRYTGDPKLREIIENAVQKLLATQTPDGYIGAYPDGGHLKNWDIWGRKYTLLGLLAWYDVTSDPTLLTAARRHADFLLAETGPGKTHPFKTDMWHGMASSSVLEPMVLLYRHTGGQKYLDYANYLIQEWSSPLGPDLLNKALNDVPVFQMFAGPKPEIKGYGDAGSSKSYEMMSCYEGLIELYRSTGKAEYLTAARKVYADIRDTEITVIGSGSDWERWNNGHNRQTVKWQKGMETCVTVTWMKFAGQLLRLTGDSSYADDIELATYNAMLGAQGVDGKWWAHHMPLSGTKERAPEQCNMEQNCCVANGPRGLMLLPQLAVMSAPDGPVVNFYAPGTTTVALPDGNSVEIKQETDFPLGDTVRFTITPQRYKTFPISFRIPAWSEKTTLELNGNTRRVAKPGTYLKINRLWKFGTEITLKLDLRARVLHAPGDDNFIAVRRGPVVLARDKRLSPDGVDGALLPKIENGFVSLSPITERPQNVWMAFRMPLATAGGALGNSVALCDFASAGNTWSDASAYRVWLPLSAPTAK